MAELTSIQGGAVLVATATFFGALVGSYAPQWLNKRTQKRNLRKSLIAEIQQGNIGWMVNSAQKDAITFLTENED